MCFYGLAFDSLLDWSVLQRKAAIHSNESACLIAQHIIRDRFNWLCGHAGAHWNP